MTSPPPAGSPEFAEWFKGLWKPPGWDTVQWDDNCGCAPLGGPHAVGCLFGSEYGIAPPS